MATYSCNYIDIGKGFLFDGGSRWVLYGDDFNPTDQSDYSAEHCTVYQATTSFNLSGFQPGHEVGTCAWEINRTDASTPLTQYYRMDFERYDGSWHISWNLRYKVDWDNDDPDHNWWARGWCYFGVDKDEIRPGYSKYRIHIYATDGTWEYYSPEFTVSNLSIDSTYHKAGYLRVEGSHLCYTDNTGDEDGMNGYGFKHKIAFDSSYASDVGSSNKGYIWLDDNNYLQIYYVDESGLRRRTYPSRERYGGAVNVGSGNKGYMRVGVEDAEQGYGHLCYVSPAGGKRRILNGPPIGYS